MIEVSQLSKRYGDILAIKDLHFRVEKGEVVGFLGPNGAGKSTTMKILTGFMAPSSGVARVCGFDVFENPIEVKKRIGYLPETPPVYGDMTVEDYLKYVAELKMVVPIELKSQVDLAIKKTDLGGVRHRLIQNLSKGFRQRVGIAQALVSNPDVLILDEPTVGLDPKQMAEIRDLIRDLQGQHTIILSTHILSEVQATCQRIIIINKGEIVVQESLENLAKLKSGALRVSLQVREDRDIAGFLRGIAGVRDVLKEREKGLWTLETEPDDRLIEAIAQKAIQSGAGLIGISSAKADLEKIFLDMTYGAQKEVSS